jgi:hypothetical protein
MPRMMAYLGGDSNTLAARRAKTGDIKLAVEYPDHDKMLIICVMQTGEVLLSWTGVRGTAELDHLEVLGKVVELEDGLVYMPGHDSISDFAPPTSHPVRFDNSKLRIVPDPGEEEDEAF